mgnify:FL=1|tara:strand:+ start:1257 stop:1433 length:177 start_codon:yes stop_codon:yes gene_type:complete
MNKEESEKMWIELKKVHKKLVLLNYSAMGDQVQAPIKRAERAVDKAMEMLKPAIEGKK